MLGALGDAALGMAGAAAGLAGWLNSSKPGPLAHAAIVTRPSPGSGKMAKTIRVQYNPTSLTFGRTVALRGGQSTPLQVDNVHQNDLSVQLFFDSFEEGKDVTLKTNDIYDLTLLSQGSDKRKLPVPVEFHWRKCMFVGVVSQVTTSFTMFLPKGTPVRADVNVTFTAVQTPREQAAGKGMQNCRMLWTVKEGDRLQAIAQQAYGDWSMMWLIARANAIYDVLGFPGPADAGRTLIIPDIHDETFEPTRETSYV